MRYYLDEEFLDLGTGQPLYLISIGIVCEDGREYYAINKNCLLDRASDWVKEHVIPNLDLVIAKPLSEIKADLLDFIHTEPEFWGYYSAYDWVVFCQIFGRMVDLPNGWAQHCNDVKQRADSLIGRPRLPPKEGVAHHALDDARWVKRTYTYLSDFSTGVALHINQGALP